MMVPSIALTKHTVSGQHGGSEKEGHQSGELGKMEECFREI